MHEEKLFALVSYFSSYLIMSRFVRMVVVGRTTVITGMFISKIPLGEITRSAAYVNIIDF